jgi:hypothetical protein
MPEEGRGSASPRKEETVAPDLSQKPNKVWHLALWRLRRLRAAMRERPARLLSIILFAVGSCAATHFGGVSLLILVMSPPIPILLIWIPVTAAGIGLVWLSLHLWEPSRKVRPRFLLWLFAATVIYTIGLLVSTVPRDFFTEAEARLAAPPALLARCCSPRGPLGEISI